MLLLLLASSKRSGIKRHDMQLREFMVQMNEIAPVHSYMFCASSFCEMLEVLASFSLVVCVSIL